MTKLLLLLDQYSVWAGGLFGLFYYFFTQSAHSESTMDGRGWGMGQGPPHGAGPGATGQHGSVPPGHGPEQAFARQHGAMQQQPMYNISPNMQQPTHSPLMAGVLWDSNGMVGLEARRVPLKLADEDKAPDE